MEPVWLQRLGSLFPLYYTSLRTKKKESVEVWLQVRKKRIWLKGQVKQQVTHLVRHRKTKPRLSTGSQSAESPTARCPGILASFRWAFGWFTGFCNKASPPWTLGSALAQGMKTTKNPMAGALSPAAHWHRTELASLLTFSDLGTAGPWQLTLSLSSFLDVFQGYT